MDCIFCKIIAGEIPATKVYEDKNMLIIEDIDKKAKKHFLLLPKSHYASLEDANFREQIALGRAIMKLPKLKEVLGLNDGYRLVINQGEDAGQTVKHLHIHILSGQKMGWNPA
ncbi:MAG: HIT domain-containing protein [Clostridia bacterium]|nr:HIT domain-containing protein [Clostridia bacterium]